MNEQKKSKVEIALEENRQKLKACNDRSRARLTEVLSIAEKVLIKTVHSEGYQPGQYGQDYRDLGKAIAEIRDVCKHDLSEDFPDYEWMAHMMTSDHFDPKRLEEEIAAKASEKPVDYPTFYTPGWLVDLAKKLAAGGGNDVHGLHGLHGLKPGDNPCESVKSVDGNKVPALPGFPSLMPLRIPGGIDGVEPAADGYEKFMTLPNGSRLVRFHGSDTIRLMTSRKGKSGNPNRIFEIFICKHGKRAYVRRDDTTLFAVEGSSVGYNVVEQLAVSALKRYMKDRMSDNAKRKRRRAAKRAAATKALIEKELA